MKPRILLAEDEEHLQEIIKVNLELESYHVSIAHDGKEALQKFKEERFNLIILDVMMPKINGFAVCEQIRLENNDVPILFLTAKNTNEDKIQGLKTGADDYLTKPFNLEEMILRVNNLIKRTIKNDHAKELLNVYTFGKNNIYFNSYEVTGIKNRNFKISKKENKLLKLLIEKEGQVVSRDLILEKVWGYDVYPSTRTIDNFIMNFRKYFETDPKNPLHFHSIRGVGYMFKK